MACTPRSSHPAHPISGLGPSSSNAGSQRRARSRSFACSTPSARRTTPPRAATPKPADGQNRSGLEIQYEKSIRCMSETCYNSTSWRPARCRHRLRRALSSTAQPPRHRQCHHRSRTRSRTVGWRDPRSEHARRPVATLPSRTTAEGGLEAAPFDNQRRTAVNNGILTMRVFHHATGSDGVRDFFSTVSTS